MKVKRTRCILFAMILFPCSYLAAQQVDTRDTSNAMLENKQQTRDILNDLHAQKQRHGQILVLYQDRFYRLSDFDLVGKVAEGGISMDIVRDPDSVRHILSREVNAIILLKEKDLK